MNKGNVVKFIDEETQAEVLAFKMPNGVMIIPDESAHPEFLYILSSFYDLESEKNAIKRKLTLAEETIDTIQEQFERGTFYDCYVDQALTRWEESQ